MDKMNNKLIYNTDIVVKEYRDHDYLIKPEQIILKYISKTKSNKRMLDIGVGAGRTTKYFAPLFEEYYGIDYAESMIRECRTKYSNFKYYFHEADARSLKRFNDNFFDFVLFSFNGIDCVSVNDRQKVLKEIFRVLKKDGLFAFSIHNINHIPTLFSFQLPKNPFKWKKEFKRRKEVHNLNPSAEKYYMNDFIEIIDGDIDFKATYIYSKPEAQVAQLKNIGFKVDNILSMKGLKIRPDNSDWQYIKDAWLYFLCIK